MAYTALLDACVLHPPTLRDLLLRLGERRINDQWRICFRWKDGDALDVEIVDYH